MKEKILLILFYLSQLRSQLKIQKVIQYTMQIPTKVGILKFINRVYLEEH